MSPHHTTRTKRGITAVLLLLTLANACGVGSPGSSSVENTVGSVRSDARQVGVAEAREVESALRNDPDARALRRIAAALAETASRRHITKAEYSASFKTGGIDLTAAKLGMPAEEFSKMASEFQSHMEALLDRYPVIAEIRSGNAALAPPAAEGVASALAEEDENGCKWLRYILCLSLCPASGPLHVACAFLCFCFACEESAGSVCDF